MYKEERRAKQQTIVLFQFIAGYELVILVYLRLMAHSNHDLCFIINYVENVLKKIFAIKLYQLSIQQKYLIQRQHDVRYFISLVCVEVVASYIVINQCLQVMVLVPQLST